MVLILCYASLAIMVLFLVALPPNEENTIYNQNKINSINFLLFAARGFIAGIIQFLIVYSIEVIPTKIRGISLGLFFTFMKLGYLFAPVICLYRLAIADLEALSLDR